MNELQISKTDIQKALSIALIVPITCFIGGFSTAKFFEPDFNSQTMSAVEQKVSLMNSLPQQNVVTLDVIKDKSKEMVKNTVIIPDNKESLVDSKAVLVASSDNESFEDAPADIQTETVFAEIVEKASYIKPQYSLEPAKPFAIQAGVFSVYKNAASLQSGLLARGIDTNIFAAEHNANPVYRVVLDRFDTKKNAREAIKTLRNRYNIGLSLTRLEDNFTNDELISKVAVN